MEQVGQPSLIKVLCPNIVINQLGESRGEKFVEKGVFIKFNLQRFNPKPCAGVERRNLPGVWL